MYLRVTFALSMAASVVASLVFAGQGNDSAERVGRKFHPGHYVALATSDDGPAAIRRALHPGVAGVQKRYTWRELEPREDEYDFTLITADLQVLEEEGAQLVVFVVDKSFRDERMTPEYLWARYTLPIRSRKPGKGYVAKRWDPFVVTRMNKLLLEVGKQFDAHPRFEGIALQESALGVDTSILDSEGYSAEAYRDALIEMLRTARVALPESQVFWYMNYLARGQQLLQSVSAAAARDGIVLGGPDALPDSDKLEKHVYPLLHRQRDSTLLFTSAQNDSFRHKRKRSSGGREYWSPLEIFEFSRDELGVQYLFWNDVRRPRPEKSYGIADAYPVMAAYPRFNEVPNASEAGAIALPR
ncbi:MAG: hypothetical protein RIA65_05680 [Woeseia sp.]